MPTISEIKQLIGHGRLEEVFSTLRQLPRDSWQPYENDLSLLEGQYHRLQRELRLGILPMADANVTRNRLTNGLLSLLDEIARMSPTSMTPSGPGATSPPQAASVAPTEALRILFLAANPTQSGQLRLGEEFREIREGLRLSNQRDHIHLSQRWAVRPRDLNRALLEEEPHILHFAGHGVLNTTQSPPAGIAFEAKATGGIVLEDKQGQAHVASAEALAGLVALFPQLQCVVLNACYSEVQAEALSEHVPYVVGMDQEVPDRTAIEFAVGFYDALGARPQRDYPFAFKLGRSAISMANLPGADIPQLREGKASTGK